MDRADIEIMMRPVPQTDGQRAVRAWCKKNASIFLDTERADPWTPIEVARLAIDLEVADPESVYSVVVDLVDAATGTFLEKRAFQAVLKETEWIAKPEEEKREAARRTGVLLAEAKFLKPLWKDYPNNYVYGEAA